VTEEDIHPKKRPDWRSQLTSFLLGTASGMATNLATGATTHRAIAASVILAAVLTVSTRLRGLEGADMTRYGLVLMLALGLLAVAAVVARPPGWTPYLMFGAAGLTGAIALVTTDPTARFRMLGGAAAVGVGAALIDVGVPSLADRALLRGAAVIGVLVALVSVAMTLSNYGWQWLRAPGSRLRGVALWSVGVALWSVGIGASMAYRALLRGVALVGVGVAVVGFGSYVISKISRTPSTQPPTQERTGENPGR
jgi:hypothetical protein